MHARRAAKFTVSHFKNTGVVARRSKKENAEKQLSYLEEGVCRVGGGVAEVNTREREEKE